MEIAMAVEVIDQIQSSKSVDPATPKPNNGTRLPERALEIIDLALAGSMDEEFIVDREKMRKTGREIAVERHGEEFVAEFEARLRGR
jgi:hypothetical protein